MRSRTAWVRAAEAGLILALMLLPVLGGFPAQGQGLIAEALVAQVVDGDTVILNTGHKVRLLGLDTPELEREGRPAEFLAHKAKEVLADLAQGKRVRLEYDKVRYDRYGRLLAYLFLLDGTDLGRELIRQGLARVYTIPPNLRFREELLAAQREALKARRGIWPKVLQQDEQFYLGNERSLIFHRPSCHLGQKTAPTNRVKFKSLSEAYTQGYYPCRICKP
ncbi:MAG: thermonuclease family protein [Desulfobaccales bacterium]